MTKVIALFGGPGVGKSSIATEIFSEMKKKNFSCEYVSEYAKEIVWEGNEALLKNQLHIFAEQFRRQWNLYNKVDYIITDSPLLLGSVYFKHYLSKSVDNFQLKQSFIDCLIKTIDESYFQFDNDAFFIRRSVEYNSIGRIQIEKEAYQIDKLILEKLEQYRIPHYNMQIEIASKTILMKYGVYK